MARKSKLDRELEKTGYSPKRTNKYDLETLEEYPDIGVEYDEALLDCTDSSYVEVEDSFVMDWRDDVDLESINELIHGAPIEWAPTVNGFAMTLKRGDTKKSARESKLETFGLHGTAVGIINSLLKGEYEIRVFRDSLIADHWEFILRPVVWWKAMDKNFGRRMDELFVRIDDWNKLMIRIS